MLILNYKLKAIPRLFIHKINEQFFCFSFINVKFCFKASSIFVLSSALKKQKKNQLEIFHFNNISQYHKYFQKTFIAR